MDLDAYVAQHHREWERLEELSRQARLSGGEADELVDRVQQVSTHLSVIRSSAPDASLVGHLSGVLARARARTVGTRTTSWRGLIGFFTTTFPAALYGARRWWVGTALANVAVGLVIGWWLVQHPSVESSLLSPAEINQLVNVDFEHYYSEFAASHFALRVWTNNAWVAMLCIALGGLGLPVIYLLWQNVLNVAVIGSIMVSHDRGALFFGLILPHGLLELTAVFVAAGSGLRIFWAWIDPGPMSRVQALGARGREAATVALGLVAVLLVTGVIEAFVTPSGLPTWARLAIGILAEVLFVLYVFVLGRRVHRRGLTGDVDALDRPDEVQVAA